MSPTPNNAATFGQRPALVGFSGDVEVWWLRALKPGFRHCAVAIDDGQGGFVFYNPLFNATELARINGDEQTARILLQKGGFVVVDTITSEILTHALPWWECVRPYNCVEGVKRVLGLDAPWVLTPWQLYGYLKKN
ncbi:MAG: hypothetical protein KAI27_05055 [Rhodospirillaceae bacterium]|nr:hypothetical protein [Rhodospirillaceae bacterium]